MFQRDQPESCIQMKRLDSSTNKQNSSPLVVGRTGKKQIHTPFTQRLEELRFYKVKHGHHVNVKQKVILKIFTNFVAIYDTLVGRALMPRRYGWMMIVWRRWMTWGLYGAPYWLEVFQLHGMGSPT